MRICQRCGQTHDDARDTCDRDGAPLQPITDSLVGTRVDRYVLVRRLGKGAMGSIYLGIHPEIESRVAIKILHESTERGEVDFSRFVMEAQAVNRIGHPNLVRINDLDQLPDGRPFIIMEYLEGQSLRERMRATPPMQPGEARDVVLQLLDALEAVHRAGFVHRDLKPDNIFVTRDGQAKVLDFGIAKLLDDTGKSFATQQGTVVGSPMYLSPEQALGEHESVGPWTDLYSVGVLLYELYTGRSPFAARNVSRILIAHTSEAPVPPSQWVDFLPPAMERLILWCLEKDPQARPQSSGALREAFVEASRAFEDALALTDPAATLPAFSSSRGERPAAPAAAATRGPQRQEGSGFGADSSLGSGAGSSLGSGAGSSLGSGAGSDSGASAGSGLGSSARGQLSGRPPAVDALAAQEPFAATVRAHESPRAGQTPASGAPPSGARSPSVEQQPGAGATPGGGGALPAGVGVTPGAGDSTPAASGAGPDAANASPGATDASHRARAAASARTGSAAPTATLPTAPRAKGGRRLGWGLLAGLAAAAALLFAWSGYFSHRGGPSQPTGGLDTGSLQVFVRALPPPKRTASGRLVVLQPYQGQSIDPTTVTHTEALNIIRQTHDPLVGYDPLTGQTVPRLATAWRRRGNRWELTLREGVRFHDGAALTARAAVASLRRALKSRLGQQYLSDVEAVSALGPRRLAIEVKRARASFLVRLSLYPFYVAKAGPRGSLGTGPFRLQSWNHVVGALVLEPNPHYWGPPPRLASVVFKSEPDADTRASLLRQGSAHLITSLPTPLKESLERRRRVDVVRFSRTFTAYLAFNTKKPALREPAVRRAIAAAVDRPALLRRLYRGSGTVAKASVPLSLLRGYEPTAPAPAPRDLRQARSTLARSRASRRPLALLVSADARPYLPEPRQAARLLKKQLARVGLEVRPRLLPFAELKKRCDQGTHDLVFLGWGLDYPDPENVYFLLSARGRAAGYNYPHFSHDRFERLLERAVYEPDPRKRLRRFHRLERIVQTERPWLPLVHVATFMARRKNARGIRFNLATSRGFNLARAWLGHRRGPNRGGPHRDGPHGR
jgi:ABC-type transport system substrate-binding protein/serine/threonine protein kinase